VDGFAKSLKPTGKTDRIVLQIFIDVSFNQEIAIRTPRPRQDTQSGQARPEPAHSSSPNLPMNKHYRPALARPPLAVAFHIRGAYELLNVAAIAPQDCRPQRPA
jgi:hypothetical protein